MKNIISTSLLLLLLTSCFLDKKEDGDHPDVRKSQKGLPFKVSKDRKSAISDLNYFFEINLENAQDSSVYTGISKVSFSFNKTNIKPKNLTIDFEGGTVSKDLINKKEVGLVKHLSRI